MTFKRQPSPRWHAEVPGTRWFRADLHVHTLDDHPCGSFRRPHGLQGAPDDPDVQRAWARALLQEAVRRGVHVLGLTPHAVRSGPSDATSATWRVIEVWNEEHDDDGVPFRDKVYAVFPGFEPSLTGGRSGVHLIFLFDPEIGRDRFLRVFNMVMGGIDPYKKGELQNTPLDHKQVFERLDDLHRREGQDWSWLCLAPHAFSGEKSLFGEMKRLVLADFPESRLTGLELGDNTSAEKTLESKGWLRRSLAPGRQSLYYASDAWHLAAPGQPTAHQDLGHRTTWVKLQQPRIAALRQAFLAAESRVLLPFYDGPGGGFAERPAQPRPEAEDRPWIRTVQVSQGSSFFGGTGTTRTFHFSPDLTCLIGGSMTGKSTLLDGLRVHFGCSLPKDDARRRDVEGRAQLRFLSGNPTVEIDIPGTDPTAPLLARFPVRFFSQGELQALVRDLAGQQRILHHLDPSRTARLEDLSERLAALDDDLAKTARSISQRADKLAEAEQQFERVKKAKEALERFAEVGADRLRVADSDVGRIETAAKQVKEQADALMAVQSALAEVGVPTLEIPVLAALLADGNDQAGFSALLATLKDQVASATQTAKDIASRLETARNAARAHARSLKDDIQKRLVERGGRPEELNEFNHLSRTASLFESYRAALEEARTSHDTAVAGFNGQALERERDIADYRREMDAVVQVVAARFGGRIRVRRVEQGVTDALAVWVLGLKQKGISQWWNGLAPADPPGAGTLLAKLEAARLSDLGMSTIVSRNFTELVTGARLYELRAIRSPDRYEIEWQMGADYRLLEDLSGGQRVSVLLSLLLEAEDPNPLVIDQPEDELDNRFLYDTVLPALRRLKGRRQVILATHNANIVVNGDADQVVALEADADRGWVQAQGAIEDPPVRDAIIGVLDGGVEAFKLRRAKYGF